MKPLVYVAGPFTKPSPMENLHRIVMSYANYLRDDGLVTPIVPHLYLIWDVISPQHYRTWIAYSSELLLHCDAMLRMLGESPGADGENELAMAHGIPVFDSIVNLYGWVREKWPASAFNEPDRKCRSLVQP